MDALKRPYPKISQALTRTGEQFPGYMAKNHSRILLQIELLWGEQEANNYFDLLLLGTRDRQGFPLEALRDISLLKQAHYLLYPTFDFNPHDPFSRSADGNIMSAGVDARRGNTELEFAGLPGQDSDATPAAVDFAAASALDPDPIPRLFEFESATEEGVEPIPQLVVSTAPPSLRDKDFGGVLQFTASPAPGGDAMAVALPGATPHAPVVAKEAPVRAGWPKIRTRRDLGEIANLWHAKKSLYEQQGKPIGEILIHYGFTDARTLRIARRMQERPEYKDQPIGLLLVEIGIVGQEDLVCALCVQSGIVMADLLTLPVPSEILKLVPSDKSQEKLVVPLGVEHDTLFLAVADPFAFNEKSFFTVLTGHKVEAVYAPRHEIVTRLNMHGFGKSRHEAKEEFRTLAQKAHGAMPIKPVEVTPVAPDISENDATIVNLVNKMIFNAIGEGASDIHLELFQGSEEADIRFRRDGHMELFSSFPRAYQMAVVSRIKIMADLDISERRRPQDGKISFGLPDGRTIDLRVVTIPAMQGAEFVIIRVLAGGDPPPLSELGMVQRDMDVFRETAHHSYGLILVCGPTGSGKTTTLHSVLNELNTRDRKIWTVEDPVEIVQPHLCQVQVHNKIGVTFASLLRSLLRADPDIIMIGEMRDQETAKIALEASMTGHLVLSTLHTNSASETVARLLDLGIDPYNLSDALLSILGQRLARKLCDACARREEAEPRELEELANEYHQSAKGKLPTRTERDALVRGWRETFGEEGKIFLRRAGSCEACNKGYKGRVGLYELLHITPAIRHLIRHQSSAPEYQAAGIAEGMRTLKQDGIERVLRGITDIKQVHSACA